MAIYHDPAIGFDSLGPYVVPWPQSRLPLRNERVSIMLAERRHNAVKVRRSMVRLTKPVLNLADNCVISILRRYTIEVKDRAHGAELLPEGRVRGIETYANAVEMLQSLHVFPRDQRPVGKDFEPVWPLPGNHRNIPLELRVDKRLSEESQPDIARILRGILHNHTP